MDSLDRQTEACCWENRSEIGQIKSFWLTLKEIFLDTKGFVASFQESGTHWAPVLFAIVASLIAFLGLQVWAEVHDWAMADLRHMRSLRMKAIVGDLKILRFVCQFASIMMVDSLLKVLACHLVMKKLCPGYRGLRVTWAAFFYMSGAAEILNVVPFVGGALVAVSRPVLLAVALAEAHRTEMRNALAGVLAIGATGSLVLVVASALEQIRVLGNDFFTSKLLSLWFFKSL